MFRNQIKEPFVIPIKWSDSSRGGFYRFKLGLTFSAQKGELVSFDKNRAKDPC